MFSTLSKREISILANSDLSFTNTFNLVRPQILSFGKELMGEREGGGAVFLHGSVEKCRVRDQ